jgi:hypothetical protein
MPAPLSTVHCPLPPNLATDCSSRATGLPFLLHSIVCTFLTPPPVAAPKPFVHRSVPSVLPSPPRCLSPYLLTSQPPNPDTRGLKVILLSVELELELNLSSHAGAGRWILHPPFLFSPSTLPPTLLSNITGIVTIRLRFVILRVVPDDAVVEVTLIWASRWIGLTVRGGTAGLTPLSPVFSISVCISALWRTGMRVRLIPPRGVRVPAEPDTGATAILFQFITRRRRS